MTLFDRYLLRRFLSVFLIMFLSTFGLFAVIDGFTNMDEFQSTGEPLEVVQRIGEYYFLQTSIFLEMVGAILSILSAMLVFAMLQKYSEIHPILAAGIPTYRLALPILFGTLCVSGILAANQEFVIPRIAHLLQSPRKATDKGQVVEPIYDSNRIHIDGRELHLASRELSQAKFVLPAPELALDLTTIRSTKATYHRPNGERPSGWLLNSARPTFDQLSLTDAGRRIVCSGRNPSDIFI
ncbi:MAG: LptF/LptG family permease, partial [Planctomycetaceae bacterium]